MLGVGELLPLGRRSAAPAPPVDISRTIEEVLTFAPLDFVHVHEPFAPSASSVALRHSRALNVGSFHAPTERVLSTQVARRFVELFFGRLDARTASFGATRDLMDRYFPANYRPLRPGAVALDRAPREGPIRFAFCAQEERQALRLFLRALRRLPEELEWEATVFSPTGAAPTGALRSRLRDRLTVLSAAETTENDVLAQADVAIAASLGHAPAPGLLVRALGAGAVPVAARLPAYEEVLGDGDLGLLFERGDVDVLAGQLQRLAEDPDLLARMRDRAFAERDAFSWSRVADEAEAIYDELAALRRPDEPLQEDVRARLATRRMIDVDIHMHTTTRSDCVTARRRAAVDAPRARARRRSPSPTTTRSPARSTPRQGRRVRASGDRRRGGRDRRPGRGHRPLHRGEDPRADQPRGDDHESASRFVYVPHPFDRPSLRCPTRAPAEDRRRRGRDQDLQPAVADRRLDEPSVRGQYGPRRTARTRAWRRRRSVRIRMHRLDGPHKFLASLRDADVLGKPSSLRYAQSPGASSSSRR